jgi:hypothetical protein
MGTFLETTDFPGLESAATLIDDAEALAMLSAPCLRDDLNPEGFKFKAARAILRGAILRWADAGTGAVDQQTAGPFAMSTTSQVRRNSFWPSEITDLQKVCRGEDDGKAYSVDTAPMLGGTHSLLCSKTFGGPCTCGADIGGDEGPLYEQDIL